jgi:hypothetical protein
MDQGASESRDAAAIDRASTDGVGGWVIVFDGTRAVARGATEGRPGPVLSFQTWIRRSCARSA